MTELSKVRVEKDTWEAIFAAVGQYRPTWDAKAGDLKLATFLVWADAVSYAFKIAERARGRLEARTEGEQ